MTRAYDRACYALAEAFLSDEWGLNTEENRKQLAADIQETIEDSIRQMRKDVE